jgi:hypothetical protein
MSNGAINRQHDEVLEDLRRARRRQPLDPASLGRVVVNPDVVAVRPQNRTGRHVVGRPVERDLDRREPRHDVLGPVDHQREILALTQAVSERQGVGCDRNGNGRRRRHDTP